MLPTIEKGYAPNSWPYSSIASGSIGTPADGPAVGSIAS